MYKKLFGTAKHASLYQRFRPTYPDTVFDAMVTFIGDKVGLHRAVDVGCGTGSSTRPLAKYFNHVIGVDISEAQVTEATQAETLQNVTYRVGSGLQIPVKSSSAQLIASSLAAHWFEPIETFYAEADRVLTPGGALVVYGYGMCTVTYQGMDQPMTSIMYDFYQDSLMAPFWTPRRHLVETHYRDLNLPYVNSTRLDQLSISTRMTLVDFAGYISTWSGYQKYVEASPDAPDPLDQFSQRLYEAAHTDISPAEVVFNVSWPVFMLMGRKN